MANVSLSIGIVGCGRMGRQHARTCQGLGHHIAFLHDAEPLRAVALAAECPHAQIVAAPGDIVWEDVDAIFVCTPPSARGPIELAAVRAGTPFFVEKPIGVNSRQCLPVLRALRDRPVVHAVGYMSRYRASVQRTREALIGRSIIGLTAHWLSKMYQKPWWLEPEQSGGPFNEQCTHFVDLFRYFGGEIEQVAATAPVADAPLVVSVTCRFTSGACGTLLYSCLSQHKQLSLKILCADGAIELDGYDLADEAGSQPTVDVMSIEVERFCQAVVEDRQDLVASSLDDAVKTQLIMDAVAVSLRTGRAELTASLQSLSAGAEMSRLI